MFLPSKPDSRLRVKICGVTHPDDADLATALGADALGLNFYPGSPRCLDPARDADWLRALAGTVRRVAVVVNAPHTQIERLFGDGLVDAVQLHGDEDPAFCGALAAERIPFSKALRVRGEKDLRTAGTFGTSWIVLDAYDPHAYGGTGRTTDWTLAARAVREGVVGGWRVILPGGVPPGNVAEASRFVRPSGVDVASGIEKTDDRRRKDPAKLRAFFSEVRAAEAK